MYGGKLVFSQVMEHLPLHVFHRCVEKYGGDYKVKEFTCLDQYLCMAFGQLTYRESLRDIEACLRARRSKLYHMGIRAPQVSRNTMSNANKVRDWRIYADLAHSLIKIARELYAKEDFGLELDGTLYAFDATTIDLCLSVFPWAPFRSTKGAIKLHTLLDLRGSIPTFIYLSDGKLHEVNTLDLLPIEAGAYYVMDRGYLDFGRLHRFSEYKAFYIIRGKRNFAFRRVYSHPSDRSAGVICDQSIKLTGYYQRKEYPEMLRRIKYFDKEKQRSFVFLTNNFKLPAFTVAEIYRYRWKVELFFRWIKQNLRIKTFYGTSENAVRTQIWVAVSVYVLVAIMKKRLNIDTRLSTILQVLSVTAFEQMPVLQAFTDYEEVMEPLGDCNQLKLF